MTLTSSYLISGDIFGLDGNATTLTNGFATFYNVNKQKHMKGGPVDVTGGTYNVDVANTNGGYDDGDVIHVFVWHKNGKLTGFGRHTVSVAGGGGTVDVYLKSVESFVTGTCRPTEIIASNSSAGGLYVDVRENFSGARVERIEVPAGDTVTLSYGGKGKLFLDGLMFEFEDATGDSMNVSMNLNEEETEYGFVG